MSVWERDTEISQILRSDSCPLPIENFLLRFGFSLNVVRKSGTFTKNTNLDEFRSLAILSSITNGQFGILISIKS